MSQLTSAQFNLVRGVKVPLTWRMVRFYQSTSQGGYCLSGFPVRFHASVSSRLQAMGCTIQRSGTTGKGALGWVHFSASHPVAAKLSLMFAAPQGATPLVVTGSASIGKRKGSASVRQFVL